MAKYPVEILIVGAGDRGSGYAEYAEKLPEKARIVGVAEPREYYRESLANKHKIPLKSTFRDWKEAASVPKMADAVIIATQDSMHLGPALAFTKKGYHVLLEKPMAPNEKDCRKIYQAVKQSGVIFAVCHVLRYTNYTRALKNLLDSGAIGEIVSMQHLEPVGFWHQAHSYVRGNWRKEKDSSFMLLAKSCHDIDWISYVMGRNIKRVSSFGSLKHFRKECRPAGAASRCLDCKVERACPYSAKRIYLGFLENKNTGWPVRVLTPDVTEKGVLKALKEGPYGRCVYACDNDVVDNQVVNMEFEGGATASFTMTAFNRGGGRLTRIFGTRGEIYGDSSKITHYDFLTKKSREIDTAAPDSSILGGHGGGDGGLMSSFVQAVANNDQSLLLSDADATIESHLAVFAAEKSRKSGRTVPVRV